MNEELGLVKPIRDAIFYKNYRAALKELKKMGLKPTDKDLVSKSYNVAKQFKHVDARKLASIFKKKSVIESFTPCFSFKEFCVEEKKVKEKEKLKDEGNTKIEINPEINPDKL